MQRFNNLNLRTTQDYVVASAPGQVDLQECSQRFHWGTFMASSSITNRRIEELTQAGRDILADAESKSRPFIGNIESVGVAKVGQGTRVRALLYSHDTFGLGHLRRNLAIADHLLERNPRFQVMLLSGSPVADSWPLPPNLLLSLMPPVAKVGAEDYVSHDGKVSFAEVKRQREAVIIETIRAFQPDVFLVDHAPAGMKGELLGALAYLRASMPQTLTVLGLRDILDEGSVVRSLWREQDTYGLIERHYEQVLVYGAPALFDVVEEYELPPAIADKLSYCGHVARPRPTVARTESESTSNGKRVLVTVGGGGDGFPAIQTYLSALQRLNIRPEQSILVTGPLMPEDQQQYLEKVASQHADVRLMRSSTEMTRLLAEADLVVSMAGYNSTVEVLAAQKPAILMPRAAPRAEQRLRAELLAKMGLAWVVRPEQGAVEQLAGLLELALSGARPHGLGCGLLDLGGARRVGDVLERLLEARISSTSQDCG